MKIWIDAKNASSQNAGIAKWSEHQLSLNDRDFNSKLLLVYPTNSKFKPYSHLNIERRKLFTLKRIPPLLSILFYDLIIFRFFAKFDKPDLIFSPYYDVLMPKSIPSIISIHDLCYLEQPALYSKLRRSYFLWIMKINAKRSKLIITVSQTSKNQISAYLNMPESKIVVLPNVIETEFNSYLPSRLDIEKFRSNYVRFEYIILYTGGFENRKNIPMLLSAIKEINASNFKICLIVTGLESEKWTAAISKVNLDRDLLSFLGPLTNQQLKIAYKSVDAIVYPSLSEGFGRSCIEAISCQTPLICSDIPVFREVAGDYPVYFNPNNLQSLVTSIKQEITNMERFKVRSFPQIQSSLKLQDVLENIINGN
jgi:glycosyltransferase involved in cell wall biosynthesis